jgi:hypothetical protein
MDKALQTAVVKYSLSWDLELAINLVIWIILLTFNCFKDPITLSLSLHWRQMHKDWQALRLSKYVEETGFAELTDGHWEVFVVDCSHLAYHSDSVEVRHPALMEVLPVVSELAMLAVTKMRALCQTHSPVHKYPKLNWASVIDKSLALQTNMGTPSYTETKVVETAIHCCLFCLIGITQTFKTILTMSPLRLPNICCSLQITYVKEDLGTLLCFVTPQIWS